MAHVSYEEWEAIPELGDYTIKNNKRFHSFWPVPDNVLMKKPRFSSHLADGTSTTNLTAVGEGRSTVLTLKLDRAADSVMCQTVVDPKGYMTELKSVKISTDTEVSDIKKARLLLKSVTQTNPNHGSGWIAAARLEELAGKPQTAKQLILLGLENCPRNEDVWLEAVRLQTLRNAKGLLSAGVEKLPQSVKLWLQAAQLEHDPAAKSRVLRKALERIPVSVKLWKEIVYSASEDEARILFSHAVECCPQQVELWLALAKLETYETARRVLNKARESIPTEAQIWFTASKLEEANKNYKMVEKIIERGIKSLQAQGIVIDRELWLKEAETCEKLKPPMIRTCHAIVRVVVDLGIEDEDKKRTWIADAQEYLSQGSVETARAIYKHALTVFPTKKSIWQKAAALEKDHGTRLSFDKFMKKAVQHCPQATVLWLMAAKEKWLSGDINRARTILAEAFRANGGSEEIWISAFKLEFETNELKRARKLLDKARSCPKSSTPRIWMKSAIVERRDGEIETQRQILLKGLQKHPGFWKLWIMLAQMEEKLGNDDAAHSAFLTGLKFCAHVDVLWTNYASFEEKAGKFNKARAILERGREKNPKNEMLLLAAIRLEIRAQCLKAADARVSKALSECPLSGLIWSQAIAMAPWSQRKSKCIDALKHCDDDPYVICAIAQLFWHDRKVDKARCWFMRSLTLAPDIGDLWALQYCFELQHGTPELQDNLVYKCKAADPHHGEIWCSVAKDPGQVNTSTEHILKKVAEKFSQQ